MATEKLNLPTITGNETADIPRDFNALANAIDSKAGSPGGLATLGAGGKVPTSQLPPISNTAADVSVADAGNYYTGTNTEAALQEVGQVLAGMRGNLVASANSLLGM